MSFTNEFRGVPQALGLFLAYLGNVPPSSGSIVPPITALDGPGSEGLGLSQRYNVVMVKGNRRTTLGSGLFAVPSNVGPRTMPNYDSLAAQGIYTLAQGVRVFAGQRDDPFYIDLGAVFDTINLRSPRTDMLSGFNVHSIALEVPASLLTADGMDPGQTTQPVLGAYASTSRRRVSVLENTAWSRTQLGNLYFNSGDLSRAEQEYQRVLVELPGYVYAQAGLGRLRAAQGQTFEAISLLEHASQSMPLPEFVITLADLYQAAGMQESAHKQQILLGGIQRLYQVNCVDLDLELALYNADHGIDPAGTLAQARQAYARRPSVYAADVLAWALYQAGDYQAALSYSQEALRLGTKDALKLFHAGMIYSKLNNPDQARHFLESALAVNPNFSIVYAPVARQTVDDLMALTAVR